MSQRRVLESKPAFFSLAGFRGARLGVQCIFHFPDGATHPAFYITGRTGEVILKPGLGQTAVTRPSHAMSPDQLALRAFYGITMFHPLFEWICFLLQPARLQNGMVFAHRQRAMRMSVHEALLPQRALAAG